MRLTGRRLSRSGEHYAGVSMSDSILQLDRVSRTFGTTKAVDQVSLDVQAGEIFTLLGPSGCGKTTTLRLVAGLEQPDNGEIWVRDRLVASVPRNTFVPPHQRMMGMVFQSYAIWPHMNVFDNVSYPLRIRRMKRAEIRERVERVLNLVGLDGLESRPAPMLSGGQQQRVALARALIYEPAVLLLDEPFSNLDSKLREQMRVEVKQLQKTLGITVLFVTHDQTEALSLSDRIAVMSDGHAIQVAEPKVLYEQPEDSFVRDFLGKMLKLPGTVVSVDGSGKLEVSIDGGSQSVIAGAHVSKDLVVGNAATLSVRPEDVVVGGEPGAESNLLEGTIENLLFVGDRYECYLQLAGNAVMISLPRDTRKKEGDTLTVYLPEGAVSAWQPE